MTNSRRPLLAVLLTAAPVLMADSCLLLPKLAIRAPVEGQSLTWMPVTIELDFQASADPDTLQVWLNGQEVSDGIEVLGTAGNRTTARVAHVWDGLVLPGANQVSARIETTGGPVTAAVSFTATGDPYADAVVSSVIGTGGGFNSTALPGIATGPPIGDGTLFLGGLDVVSLGLAGEIVVRFDDNVIVDGPGVDLLVFENPFLEREGALVATPFAEPGQVSVSQDGATWHDLGTCVLADPGEPPWYPDCAGVYPVLTDGTAATPHASVPTPAGAFEALEGQLSFQVVEPPGAGGDGFDLADTPLSWARYVRVVGADFVPDGVSAPETQGFDFDAAAAVHSLPFTDENENGIPDLLE